MANANVTSQTKALTDIAGIVHACLPQAHELQAESSLPRDTPVALAIGAFDGVHRGHQELLRACVATARTCGGRSVALTFDPDPSEVLQPEASEPCLLATRDRRTHILAMGIDEVLVVPFSTDFAYLTPQDFISWLCERIPRLRYVHVGANFRFGRGGAGDAVILEQLGATAGFEVHTHALLTEGGDRISSTRIRALLSQGQVQAATELLGRSHFVRGTVIHGRGEGSSFGFPTANVSCDARSCMPCEGVYACIVTDGAHAWPAAANVGMPPSFASHENHAFLEANLLGFEGDLYGQELVVIFVAWLRASRAFDSLEELERTVLSNIDWVRTHLGASAVAVIP